MNLKLGFLSLWYSRRGFDGLKSWALSLPRSPASRPESDNSFFHFSAASIASRISCSTTSRGRE